MTRVSDKKGDSARPLCVSANTVITNFRQSKRDKGKDKKRDERKKLRMILFCIGVGWGEGGGVSQDEDGVYLLQIFCFECYLLNDF